MDEWITAKQAIELARKAMPRQAAPRAICSRAHDGLIKAKARRLVIGQSTKDDANVPAAFWWARGEAALQQNWVTGDFETWIKHTVHWKAFGVEFLRRDIFDMLRLEDSLEAEAGAAQAEVGERDALIAERDALKSELESLRSASQSDAARTRVQNTLLTMIAGMAVAGYSYDPFAKRSQIPVEIASDLAQLGLNITDETVRKYLSDAVALIDADVLTEKFKTPRPRA